MTTVEKMNLNQTLLRPTDLSIKNCLSGYNSKLENVPLSLTTTKPHRQDHRTSGPTWMHQSYCDPKTVPSTIALLIDQVYSPATRTSAAISHINLAAYDSYLSQCRASTRTVQDAVNSVYDPSYRTVRRSSSKSSASSDELAPTRGRFLGAINDLTELQRNHKRNDNEQISPTATRPRASTPTKGRWRGCKRKGGWKFHDLSDESDGLGRRKRTYCNNQLENEIVQIYQDRISIKEVPANSGSKAADRLVILEPSYVTDPDLIKHNTGLRIIFNKKRGTYELQILPFTLEQGSLSDKSQVLSAVAKMLGENGAVLCPGISRALLMPHLYQVEKRSSDSSDATSNTNGELVPPASLPKNTWLGFTPPTSENSTNGDSGGDRFRRWKILNNSPSTLHDAHTPSSPGTEQSAENLALTPTDRLLLTINKELVNNQRKTSRSPIEAQVSSNRCLLWHVPTPNGKGKHTNWPLDTRMCSNCMRNKLCKTD